MQEIFKLMNSLSYDDMLGVIKIGPGKIFVRAHLNKPITADDVFISTEPKGKNVEKKTIFLGNLDLEDYFKERYFYENYISASSCGKVGSHIKFEDKTNVHCKKSKTVTPYSFIMNMDNKAYPLNKEENRKLYIKTICQKVNKDNEVTEEEIDKITNCLSDAFRDVQNIEIEGEKVDIDKKELAIFVDDYPVVKQKDSYQKYIESNWKFGEEKIIDGVAYAFPTIFNTANDRKPTLYDNNNMRKGGILVTKEEGIKLMYLFKLGINNLISLLNKRNPEIEYSIGIDKEKKITTFSAIKKQEKKMPFYNFKINQSIDMDLTPAKELKSQEDIRNILSALYFKDILFKILYTPNDSLKISDLFVYADKLQDFNIDSNTVQLLYSHKESLQDYFNNGEHPERIINVLKKAMLNSFKKNLSLGEERDFDQERRLDNIINISYCLGNQKEKEDIKSMLNKMDKVRGKLDDFIKKDSEVKEFTIDNDEEFAYYVGQVIQGLISLSQSDNINDLIISYSEIRGNKHLRNAVIRLYKQYAYAIKYNSKFNTVVSKVLEYEANIKSNELWFYYYSGLIGPNRFYYLKDNVKVDN